jgi:hypothetical protein
MPWHIGDWRGIWTGLVTPRRLFLLDHGLLRSRE